MYLSPDAVLLDRPTGAVQDGPEGGLQGTHLRLSPSQDSALPGKVVRLAKTP